MSQQPTDLERARAALSGLDGLLSVSPELTEAERAERLVEYLEALALQEEEGTMEEQLSLRVAEGTKARADALILALRKHPDVIRLGLPNLNRSGVLRLALSRGLEALEAETKKEQQP